MSVGLGLQWRIAKSLRMNMEVGVAARRQLSVESEALGTLSEEDGDPAAYIELRLAVRP